MLPDDKFTLISTAQCVVLSFTSNPKLHISIKYRGGGGGRTEGGEVEEYTWIWVRATARIRAGAFNRLVVSEELLYPTLHWGQNAYLLTGALLP